MKDAIVELSSQHQQLTLDELRHLLHTLGRPALDQNYWINLVAVVQDLIKEGRVAGRVGGGGFFNTLKFFFDVDANRRLLAEKQSNLALHIKKVILDLGTKFTRLQVAEIAETCGVADEALLIETVQDMIAKHQVDAQYFTSTKAVAFNQQANLAARDAFIAGLEAEFANWGKESKHTKRG